MPHKKALSVYFNEAFGLPPCLSFQAAAGSSGEKDCVEAVFRREVQSGGGSYNGFMPVCDRLWEYTGQPEGFPVKLKQAPEIITGAIPYGILRSQALKKNKESGLPLRIVLVE